MEVQLGEYLREHGKPPAGEGSWQFVLIHDDGDSRFVLLSGDFKACATRAAEMADDGLREIVLMP